MFPDSVGRVVHLLYSTVDTAHFCNSLMVEHGLEYLKFFFILDSSLAACRERKKILISPAYTERTHGAFQLYGWSGRSSCGELCTAEARAPQ